MIAKLNRWTSVLRNTDEYFRRAVVENQEEMLDLNIAQLESGKDSLGQLLDDYASDAYAKMKVGPPWNSKAPLGTPNLRLEGDFHEGFILRYEGDTFIFTSTDEKRSRLVDKYGIDLFGISEEDMPQVRNMLLESFLKFMRWDVVRN